jgi:hypothetical protein
MSAKAAAFAPQPADPARPRLVRKPDGKARVPETAIKRGGEVSPAAYRLYTWYCARRNNESGGWRVPNKEAAEALGISRNRVCEARNELRAGGWIKDLGGDFIRPLVGFDAVEDSTQPVENSIGAVEDSTQPVENSIGAIDKDRARGSYTSYSPPTTAHTLSAPFDAHPSATRATRAGGGGRFLSSFNLQTECLPWAKAMKAADPSIRSAAALARARYEDGTADDEIAAWLEGQTPEAVTRSLQTPTRSQMSFRGALVHIGSILDVNTQLDIPGAVAQLDVSPETRARLLAYDFSKRRGAAAREAKTL